MTKTSSKFFYWPLLWSYSETDRRQRSGLRRTTFAPSRRYDFVLLAVAANIAKLWGPVDAVAIPIPEEPNAKLALSHAS
jgi:hypothetical protein